MADPAHERPAASKRKREQIADREPQRKAVHPAIAKLSKQIAQLDRFTRVALAALLLPTTAPDGSNDDGFDTEVAPDVKRASDAMESLRQGSSTATDSISSCTLCEFACGRALEAEHYLGHTRVTQFIAIGMYDADSVRTDLHTCASA